MYLKLRTYDPYRQAFVAQHRNEKLTPCYFGPYEMIEKIGKVAYKLKLPPHSVHASQLKKAVLTNEKVHSLPLILSSTIEWNVEPEEIVGIRKGVDSAKPEVLVRWK